MDIVRENLSERRSASTAQESCNCRRGPQGGPEMAAPEVSVIIPSFGRQQQLMRAARSALAQDVDLELIVVDDGSPTPLTIDLDRERTVLVRLDVNSGAAAARNAGAAAARAHWIAFLDSDDCWPSGVLRPRLEAARTGGQSEATIWAGAFTDVWPDGRRLTRHPRASCDPIDFASGCWTCPGSTALLSREAWRRSGGQDPALRRLEDYEWLMRWGFAGGRIGVYADVAAEISRGGRATPATTRAAADYIRAKHGATSAGVRRRIESYLALELAAACLHHGEVVGGTVALARSWWLKPRLRAALEPFWTS
jgi:glycosyltransferase involved in cell wall biosynthesis